MNTNAEKLIHEKVIYPSPIEEISGIDRDKIVATSRIGSFHSIVEELVLNSIDASSSAIEVGIDMGNLDVIVTDDGYGIGYSDLSERIGEWHCSSKSEGKDDYGFKGQALAAIRVISEFLSIESKPPGATHGCKKVMVGERQIISMLSKKDVELSSFQRRSTDWKHGTIVTIKGIFNNLPVRKKSLRKDVEVQAVKQFIQHMSIMHHQIKWRLYDLNQNLAILKINSERSVSKRLVSLYGSSVLSKLCHVSVETGNGKSVGESSFFQLDGLISKPDNSSCHWNKDYQHMFINNRWLKSRDIVSILVNRVFSKALSSAGQFGPEPKHAEFQAQSYQKFPYFALKLTCPDEEYDMSAETDKSIVFFRDKSKIESLVLAFLTKLGSQNHLLIDAVNRIRSSLIVGDSLVSSDNFEPSPSLSVDIERLQSKSLTVVPAISDIRGKYFDLAFGFDDSSKQLNTPSRLSNLEPSTPKRQNFPIVREIGACVERLPRNESVSEDFSPFRVPATSAALSCATIATPPQPSSLPRASVKASNLQYMNSREDEDKEEKEMVRSKEFPLLAFDETTVLSGAEEDEGDEYEHRYTEKFVSHHLVRSSTASSILTVNTPQPTPCKESPHKHASGKKKRASADFYLTESSYTVDKEDIHHLHCIGQVEDKYIATICASNGIICLLDQHAVDERIRVEALYTMIDQAIVSSPVSPPISVTIDEDFHRILLIKRSLFQYWKFEFSVIRVSCGLRVEILSVPKVLGEPLTAADFVEFCYLLKSNLDIPDQLLKPPAIHRIFISKACRSSIKFGNHLTKYECNKLLSELTRTSLPFQCAHGRPSIYPTIDISQIISRKAEIRNRKIRPKFESILPHFK